MESKRVGSWEHNDAVSVCIGAGNPTMKIQLSTDSEEQV